MLGSAPDGSTIRSLSGLGSSMLGSAPDCSTIGSALDSSALDSSGLDMLDDWLGARAQLSGVGSSRRGSSMRGLAPCSLIGSVLTLDGSTMGLALDSSALDSSALDSSAIDGSALDSSALDSSALDADKEIGDDVAVSTARRSMLTRREATKLCRTGSSPGKKTRRATWGTTSAMGSGRCRHRRSSCSLGDRRLLRRRSP
jgi:hypothetical protein